VLVAGAPEREVLEKLRHGVHLAEGFAKVVSVRIKSSLKQSTVLEIVLNEGRNREIRRLLARVGHKVLRLKRIAIGGVRLKEMVPGEVRRLTDDELKLLRASSRPTRRAPRPPRPPVAKDVAAAPVAAEPVAPQSARSPRSQPSRPDKPRGRGPKTRRRGPAR
jgi:23S rRNA pseudouridine2605 synthase